MERIILAFPKDETMRKIQSMLEGTSFSAVAVCHSCSEAVRSFLELDSAVVLMSYKLPDGTCDDVFDSLPPHSPVITLTKAENIENIRNIDIFALPMPVNRAGLIKALETCCGTVFKRRKKPECSMEEKSLIQKAKLKLIENYMMTEEQAHRFIQKRSMDTGMKITETAKMILSL